MAAAPMLSRLLQLVLVGFAVLSAYQIRLFAVKNYGMLIHEFDPWFNFRATQYLADNGAEKVRRVCTPAGEQRPERAALVPPARARPPRAIGARRGGVGLPWNTERPSLLFVAALGALRGGGWGAGERGRDQRPNSGSHRPPLPPPGSAPRARMQVPREF